MNPDNTDIVVVLVTGPDPETLGGIGRRVVEDRLAACTNILGGVSSVYRWQGDVEVEDEALAIIKTTGARVSALQRAVCELHPYEEPEFIVLPVVTGSRGYLEWVADSVRADSEA
jgi:periplasmic divalent cation tolerance protein